MEKEKTSSWAAHTGFLALIFFVPSFSMAENQLRFVVRSQEIVDVHLRNSDPVAAMQLFIHLDGPGTITSADLIDRTDESNWQLPFNVLGARDIRLLLISSNSGVLQPGGGSVIRLYLTHDPGSDADSTSLFFQTAILASRDGQALEVDAQSITFERTQKPEIGVRLNNYPNPFNPSTRIFFELKRSGEVDLSIFDLQGRRIVVLLNDQVGEGSHTVQWNGADEQGRLLPSGLYICRILVDGKPTARKMILAK